MKTWLMHHKQALLTTLAQMAMTPFASLFTVLTIGITLSLPASMVVILDNATHIASTLPNPNEISVYMDEHASAADIAQLKTRLSALPGIANARFISKQAALDQIGKQLNLTQLIAGLPTNPLPDAWIITPQIADAQHNPTLTHTLQALPHVARVQTDHLWAQRLDAVIQLGRDMLSLLASILAIALIAITSNTIRLQISTRHAEIEVSRLIGATDRFIRRPFLYFGAIQGWMGGMIAWLLILISMHLLTPQVNNLATLYNTTINIHALSIVHGAILLTISAILGWIGAYFAVHRSLARIAKF